MKAIIISAGKGTRLYPLTKNTPKSLLEIGDGVTLLETQLHALEESGITDVAIIVGYKAEQIEMKIKDYNKFNITTIYNPFFETSNNLVSVWMAKHIMPDEDFITINGDDVFKSCLITNLLKSTEDITMVIDEKETYDDDDMKVIHENGKIQQVSKKIALTQANGESVGIIKFSGKGRKIYIDTLEEMVRNRDNMDVFYLKALQNIIDKGYPVHYSMCKETDWGEIDFHPDLMMIRKFIKKNNMLDEIIKR
jgi:L-glutamine-phosphate cytidylyltransferase